MSTPAPPSTPPPPPLLPFTMNDLIAWLAMPQRTPQLQQMYDFNNSVLVLGLTLDGEGRGESVEGRTAIAWTVRNRQAHYGPDKGHSIAEVCLRRLQYSCWWEVGGKDNYARLLRLADWTFRRNLAVLPTMPERRRLNESLMIAVSVLQDKLEDPTKGATHYMTRTLYRLTPPRWALEPQVEISARIGSHFFFTGVR